MIKRIKKLINEVYDSSFSLNQYDVDVYRDSDSKELSKLINQCGELRFVIADYYYVWDSSRAIHKTVEDRVLGGEVDSGFKGRIHKDGYVEVYAEDAYNYLADITGEHYKYRLEDEIKNLTDEEREDYENGTYTFYHNDFIITEFKQTELFKQLSRIGIDDVSVVSWR